MDGLFPDRNLPAEISSHIFSFTDIRTLGVSARVSRSWYEALSTADAWRPFVQARWDGSCPPIREGESGRKWARHYLQTEHRIECLHYNAFSMRAVEATNVSDFAKFRIFGWRLLLFAGGCGVSALLMGMAGWFCDDSEIEQEMITPLMDGCTNICIFCTMAGLSTYGGGRQLESLARHQVELVDVYHSLEMGEMAFSDFITQEIDFEDMGRKGLLPKPLVERALFLQQEHRQLLTTRPSETDYRAALKWFDFEFDEARRF